MANLNDSQIVQAVLSRPALFRLDAFLKYHQQIQDDSTYWQVLAALWIGHGTNAELENFTRLFSSKRRNRHKLMKGKDRQVWRSLPSVVTAYRAADPLEILDRAIAWSLDLSVLERIWKGRPIFSRQFKKENIIAYFDRRGEREIIVLQGKP